MSAHTLRHPVMFLNAGELADIRNRLGREPWARAYGRLIDSAEAATRREPRPAAGEYTQQCRAALFRDCGAVRDLGLAFALTGEERYARRAAAFLLAWSSDLSPRFPAPDVLPDLCAALSSLAYGVDLLWRARGFTDQDKNQVARWMDDLACDLETKTPDLSAAPWARLLFASAAVVVEDPRWFEAAFGGFGALLAAVMEPGGIVRPEAGGGEELKDALLTLKSLTCLAEAARHQGIDLYNHESEGKCLRSAFLAHAPFLTGRAAWPGSAGTPWESHSEAYEIAFRTWGDEDFSGVLRTRGRNAWDGRVLGPVTLTHGADFGDGR